MVFRMLKRSFAVKNSVGWIALGVATLLAVPSVRRVLRSATLNAAVGVMALGDGVGRLGVRKNHGSVQTDAGNPRTERNVEQTHDQWQPQKSQERPWLRQAVVNGLASTMNATEGVVEGTKDWVRKVRTVGSTEIGQMGTDTVNHGNSLLSDHLLPQTDGENTRRQYSKRGLPDDFAVKNHQALLHFAHDVDQVGADFKPDYHSFVDMLKSASD